MARAASSRQVVPRSVADGDEPPGREPAPATSTAAVIDCGTTSVRAYLAELTGDRVRILEDLVHPVELSGSFIDGKLSSEGMDEVVEALTGIVTSMKAYGITEVRAVGTSALREASNTDVLVERVHGRLGIEIEVLGSAEESRLYVEALRRLCDKTKDPLTGDVLFLDVGGGGTCIAVVRDGKLIHSVDEHFGTQRTLAMFHRLRDTADFAVTVDRFALGVARVMLGRVPRLEKPRLIVNGGDIRRLAATISGGVETAALASLKAADVQQFFAKMDKLTPAQRASATGFDQVETAMLLPAACLVRHLTAETGASEVIVPKITLRDGLLADRLPGALGPHHLDRLHLLAEARQLATRYGSQLSYVENTASLAGQIYDQTTGLHGLGARERVLLEFAAIVHDVGAWVNVRERHKHSQYLIQHSDIAGLTDVEKDVVAQVARYHRRSSPQPHHAEFMQLARRDRVIVSQLAAILRLAYAVDVERSQRIRKVACQVAGGKLLLTVDRRQIELERWSLDGKSRMFEEVFGLPVRILPREER